MNSLLAPLAIASDLTPNPGRGYYQWRSDPGDVPLAQSAPPQAAYQRYLWKDLEGNTPGQYTLGNLVAARDAARAAGRQFAFRIQAMRGYGTYVGSGVRGGDSEIGAAALLLGLL